MPDFAPYYLWDEDRLYLSCHLQPKASNCGFVGTHGDRLKIRVRAQPIEGRANQELIAFIAKAFGVSRSEVSVVAGEHNRQKRIQILQPLRIPEELNIPPQET